MNIFALIYRAFIYLFMLFIYLSMHSRCCCCCCCSSSAPSCVRPLPRGPTLRPLQGLSAYDNTNLIVSLRRLQSACLPSSLLLPFFRLLLLHFLFFLCFFFLLVLSAAVCVMRFQCRRVDFSWRPAKECQYYLSSLVCFSMDRQTDGQCRLFLLFFSLG